MLTFPSASDPAGELRAMLRDVEEADGVHRILDRLSQRLRCRAVLVAPSGRVTPAGEPLPPALAADAQAVADGRADAASLSVDDRPARVLPLGGGAPRPVLVVLGRAGQAFPPEYREMLAHATIPLGLAWRTREARQDAARLDVAEARNRAAVLYLLQVGDVAAARLVSNVLGPPLPDTIRVHLVEGSGRRRVDTARWCADTAAGRAWVVRCPVYNRHVVVVARSDADDFVDALRELVAGDAAYHVGSSEEVALTDFAAAYRHAFHAVAVARHRPERYAAFRDRGELAELLAGVGAAWAAGLLAPLRAYRPARAQDPDADELLMTLTSWLTFHGRAARHLRVHRNTLTTRLRNIESVLGADLADVGTQSRLNLALRLAAPTGTPAASLDELLARPEVRGWAQCQLAPLRGSDPRLLDTLRAWLDHGAQVGPAAAALRVSASGLRKRLIRVEELIQRSLLDSPSARYDLCLALESLRHG